MGKFKSKIIAISYYRLLLLSLRPHETRLIILSYSQSFGEKLFECYLRFEI